MSQREKEPNIPSKYFKSLSKDIIEKIEAKEYNFNELPEVIQSGVVA